MSQGSAPDAEWPLAGGRWTAGVVRIGETVRRPASPASPFVAHLLAHLAEKGFEACPRHLGWDEHGREVLSFVPGHVPPRWRRFTAAQVARAATILRQMHDATRDLALRLGGGEVVCHHDPGPNNAVFRHGLPVAFIDFDFSAPGDPIEDVAYLAWTWCVSSRPDRGPVAEQARQVRVLTDAYGLASVERARLTAAIHARLRRNEAFWREVCDDPQAPQARRARAAETLSWTRRESAYFKANQEVFATLL